MVELENHKAEFGGKDDDGYFIFKDTQTFDEIKVKESDVDEKMKAWLRGTRSRERLHRYSYLRACFRACLTHAPQREASTT